MAARGRRDRHRRRGRGAPRSRRRRCIAITPPGRAVADRRRRPSGRPPATRSGEREPERRFPHAGCPAARTSALSAGGHARASRAGELPADLGHVRQPGHRRGDRPGRHARATAGHRCATDLHLAGGHLRLRRQLVRGERAGDRRAGRIVRASASSASSTPSDGWAFGPSCGSPRRRRAPGPGSRPTGCGSPTWRRPAAGPSRSSPAAPGRGADLRDRLLRRSRSTRPGRAAAEWQPVPVPAAGTQRPGTGAGEPGGREPGSRRRDRLPADAVRRAAQRAAHRHGLDRGQPAVGRRHVRCLPGAPEAGGQPTGAQLAASANAGAGVHERDQPGQRYPDQAVVKSADGGVHWSAVGAAPQTGIATSLAIQARTEPVVLATDRGPLPLRRRRQHLAAASASPAAPRPGRLQLRRDDQRDPRRRAARRRQTWARSSSPPTAGSTWQPHRSARPVSPRRP